MQAAYQNGWQELGIDRVISGSWRAEKRLAVSAGEGFTRHTRRL